MNLRNWKESHNKHYILSLSFYSAHFREEGISFIGMYLYSFEKAKNSNIYFHFFSPSEYIYIYTHMKILF